MGPGMGKTVHRRRIRGPLMQIALLACFLRGAAGAAWHSGRADWLAWLSGRFLAAIMYWLRIVADGLTILGCACACFVLGRLVWLMRRQPPSGRRRSALMLVLGVAGAKRLLDLLGYSVGRSGAIATILGLSSLVLAGGVVLLLPMLYQVKAFGEAAELAHERFVSAAETGRQAFFIVESDRRPIQQERRLPLQLRQRERGEAAAAPPARAHRHAAEPGAAHAARTAACVERLRQVERTGLPYSGEIRYRSDSGDDLWFELQAVKMQSGVAVTLHDLSAERSGQRQVEQMHRFSQSLIHDAPFAILTTDTAGTITAMNPAAERLTGFGSDAVVGHASLRGPA